MTRRANPFSALSDNEKPLLLEKLQLNRPDLTASTDEGRLGYSGDATDSFGVTSEVLRLGLLPPHLFPEMLGESIHIDPAWSAATGRGLAPVFEVGALTDSANAARFSHSVPATEWRTQLEEDAAALRSASPSERLTCALALARSKFTDLDKPKRFAGFAFEPEYGLAYATRNDFGYHHGAKEQLLYHLTGQEFSELGTSSPRQEHLATTIIEGILYLDSEAHRRLNLRMPLLITSPQLSTRSTAQQLALLRHAQSHRWYLPVDHTLLPISMDE